MYVLLLLLLIPLIFGVPVLLGLIIYLLVRGKHSDQTGSTQNRSGNKTLIKILLVVLIVPIILIFLLIFLVFFLGMSRQSVGISTTYCAIPIEEYLETSEQRELVEDWLNSCVDSSDSECYVLQYTPAPEEGEDSQYLIYIPEASGYIDMDTDLEKKFFSRWVFQVEIQCSDDADEPLLFFVTYNSTKEAEEITVFYNGQELETNVTLIQQPFEN